MSRWYHEGTGPQTPDLSEILTPEEIDRARMGSFMFGAMHTAAHAMQIGNREMCDDIGAAMQHVRTAFQAKWRPQARASRPPMPAADPAPRDIDDEPYSHKSLHELSDEQRDHLSEHYPDIYASAVAVSSFDQKPFGEWTPSQRALYRSMFPDTYEELRAQHADAPWAGVPFAQLSPMQRHAFERGDPTGYAVEKARHEQAAASIAREPWKYLQFHELSGTQKAAYKRAEPAAYARARAAALGASA